MGQDNRDERCYGIKELAELGGVTRRTVRYYVQRGFMPTPLGTGRGPHYTPAHLERLIQIRKLQEAGVPLAEIATRLDAVPQTPASASRAFSTHTAALVERSAFPATASVEGVQLNAPPSRRTSSTHTLPAGGTWMRFVLADGVELHVRADAACLQPSQLARLVEATRQTLGLQSAPYPSERKGPR